MQPGAGMHANAAQLDPKSVATYTSSASHLTTVDFLMNIIPTTIVNAFATGDILQVLFFSVLFGVAVLHLGTIGKQLVGLIDQFTHALFGMVGIIMYVSPIGAFGAMAYTIGQFGIHTLLSLGALMAVMVFACLFFIFIVLAAIAWWAGFSLFKYLAYIKEEILIVLGTSSSETVLPRMMAKLEHAGCAKPVVGLVIPTGYSFNLDGTSIYMSMAAIFIAQATDTPLTLTQQLGILAVLLLTSKGAAGVTGSGFITLAATLSSIPTLPVAGLALLIGIDRFMSGARSLTNLIGNGLATIVVAKWDKQLDMRRLKRVFDGETITEAQEPEEMLLVDHARYGA
jgi:aerobic C4-dicarboxylate transport protein